MLVKLSAACSLLLAIMVAPASGLEQAGGYIDTSSTNFDGIKGLAEIRTGPPTVVGVAYTHPTQVDLGPVGGNFLAIGTARGKGEPNTGCDDDYDDYGWTVYTDGSLGGAYFCSDEDVDRYFAGDNPFFKISYTACGAGNGWAMRMGNTQYRCYYTQQHTAQRVSAFLETVGSSTTDRNIDVKYTNLQHSIVGSGFVDWGTAHRTADYDYDVTQPIDTSINAYKAPLD